MLIYNVTSQVNWGVHEQWLSWMKDVHIPEVLATGLFTHHRLLRLLEIDETEGPTYAVQYFTPSRDKYQEYITHHSPALRNKVMAMWGNEVIAFRTLMETVE